MDKFSLVQKYVSVFWSIFGSKVMCIFTKSHKRKFEDASVRLLAGSFSCYRISQVHVNTIIRLEFPFNVLKALTALLNHQPALISINRAIAEMFPH